MGRRGDDCDESAETSKGETLNILPSEGSCTRGSNPLAEVRLKVLNYVAVITRPLISRGASKICASICRELSTSGKSCGSVLVTEASIRTRTLAMIHFTCAPDTV